MTTDNCSAATLVVNHVDRRSLCAQVINNGDLLAHISSFMHFSKGPQQQSVDEGWRLALLTSRTMLPNNREKAMRVVHWSCVEMVAYLSRRTPYIQRLQVSGEQPRPSGDMPVDLPIVRHQLEVWLDRRSDELKAFRTDMKLFKLHQIMHYICLLQREHERWDEAAATPMFFGARERLLVIMRVVTDNITEDSMRRESAHFDSTSQMLLEIIAARLTAPVDDSPQGKERQQLQDARATIDNWRKVATKDYQLDDARVTNDTRLGFYERTNGRLKSAAAWFNQPCDGTGIPFVQYFAP